MGEHGFYELARRSPAASTESIVLFDAGPSQLGLPRIAHIAALIVLETRAQRSGVPMRWGVLQDPGLRLLDEVTQLNVLELLAARTAREVHVTDLDAWADCLGLGARRIAPDDVWIVGAPRLERLGVPRGVSLFVADVPPTLEAPALNVSARRAGAPAREIELALPPPRTCARLIKNPFGVDRRRLVRKDGTAAATDLLLTQSRSRFFVRHAKGAGLTLHGAPRSPWDEAPTPRYIARRDEGLIAAGCRTRRAYTITSSKGVLQLNRLSKQGRLQNSWTLEPPPDDVPFWHPADNGWVQPMIIVDGRAGEQAYFLDAAGTLFRTQTYAPRTLEPMVSGVVGLTRRWGRTVIVVDRDPSTFAGTLDRAVPEPIARGLMVLDRDGALGYHFRFPTSNRSPIRPRFGPAPPTLAQLSPLGGPLAVELAPEQWSVFGTSAPSFTVERGTSVAGVVQGDDARCVLFVVRDDRRTVERIGETAASTLFTCGVDITAARVSATSPHLFCLGEDGRVEVYDFQHRRTVLSTPGPRR